MVVSRDSSNMAKIYINGVLDGTTTLSGSIASTNNLNIGRNTVSGGDLYKGVIDQVRIYDHTLNTSEINSLYNES